MKKKIGLLKADLKKAEENYEINRYKNLKCLMRNLTGRIIFEEDSSFDDDDDEEDDELEEEEIVLEQKGEDLNSSKNLDESNLMLDNEEKEMKRHDFLNSMENHHIISKIDNIKENDVDLIKSQQEFLKRLSIIIPKTPLRNSLILPRSARTPNPQYSNFLTLPA